MITVTVLATCDHDGCSNAMVIDAGKTQRNHYLMSAGWWVDLLADPPLTYCPAHVDDAAAPR